MKLPFISTKKHNRLIFDQGQRCRETLIIRHQLWDINHQMAEQRITELELKLARFGSTEDKEGRLL